MQDFFDTKIEFLKGVGYKKSKILQDELSIFTFADLINHFPFRYEDKTSFHKISQLRLAEGNVQLKGKIIYKEEVGLQRKKRLVASFVDDTGDIELIWFKGVSWMNSNLKVGTLYIVYGKPTIFNGKYNILHPEINPATTENIEKGDAYQPVYSTTEKLIFFF